MPPIRNSAVAVGQLTGGGNTVLYTVPTGYVFLLKSVQIYWTGTPGAFAFALFDPTSNTYVWFIQEPSTAPNSINVQTWVALNAGQEIIAGLPTGLTINYWISGALLPHVPGF